MKSEEVILIYGSKLDRTIDLVIDWLIFLNKKYIRVNFDDFYQRYLFSKELSEVSESFTIEKDDNELKLSSVWFRLEHTFYNRKYNDYSESFSLSINENLYYENSAVKKALLLSIENINSLSTPNSQFINKYEVLKEANKAGLHIPGTIITNTKKELIRFKKKYNKVICKAVGENLKVLHETEMFQQFVKELSNYEIDKMPNIFFPSLFQERIECEFHIRVFYIDGMFYSMAIFSKSIDYRETDHQNRHVPYLLPYSIKTKLEALLKTLDLNTASIDLLMKQDSNDIYFLEINPNGQFGDLSFYCNYQIEEQVAKFLSEV